MIVASIDLLGGQAVQLIGGREKAIDAGDPIPIAERFRVAGDLAVVDLDAALGRGSNADLVRRICRLAPCRVGGGIRSVAAATAWLDAGASHVVIGTAAEPGLLRALPSDRVIVALDAIGDQVVVDGWRSGTGRSVFERLEALRGLAAGFLVTVVEREGRMSGVDLDRAARLRDAASPSRLTLAGGVTTAGEVAALDRMGIDAQVGMALYTGRLELADGVAAPLVSDRADGLWPTVVTDESGRALGLAHSSRESLRRAIDTRRGIYHSRRRGIWTKGETSGMTQELRRVDLDCDRDALRFTVRQAGSGFCHTGADGCWGPLGGLAALERTVRRRASGGDPGSYTARLLADPALLGGKLAEEAAELAAASEADAVVREAADLFYFAMVAMARGGASLAEVERELDRRALAVSRRPGLLKVLPETES